MLRMLHFLFTDPSTGRGQPFYDMMADFVDRHRNGSASTENFIAVANEHFKGTPIAQAYRLQDLNWFFAQWVYDTPLPTYRMEYKLENQSDGAVSVVGTLGIRKTSRRSSVRRSGSCASIIRSQFWSACDQIRYIAATERRGPRLQTGTFRLSENSLLAIANH